MNSSGFGVLGILFFILWIYFEIKNRQIWQRVLTGAICIPMLLIGFDGIYYVSLSYEKEFSKRNIQTISQLI